MAARLIIDGNTVYEIDEDCLECQKKKAALPKRMWQQDCGSRQKGEAVDGEFHPEQRKTGGAP